MKRLWVLLGAMILMLTALTGCGEENGKRKSQVQDQPIKLTISAAASLKDAALELKELYGKQHADVIITYNFGASGTLQKQIEEGAPVDLFISADTNFPVGKNSG